MIRRPPALSFAPLAALRFEGAKLVKVPAAKYEPTLPFTDGEMEKIIWAAEYIREAHPKIPRETPKKLLALILLMRYAGRGSGCDQQARCCIQRRFRIASSERSLWRYGF